VSVRGGFGRAALAWLIACSVGSTRDLLACVDIVDGTARATDWSQRRDLTSRCAGSATAGRDGRVGSSPRRHHGLRTEVGPRSRQARERGARLRLSGVVKMVRTVVRGHGGSVTRFAGAEGLTLLLVAALVAAGASSCGKARSDSHPSTQGGSSSEGGSGSPAGAGTAAAGNEARGGDAGSGAGAIGGQGLAGGLGLAGGGGRETESGGSGGVSGASGAPDGGAGAGNCDALQQAANVEFRQAVQENGHCENDEDCARLTVVADCVGVCGVVVSKLGADAVQAAASEACRFFDARGCMPLVISCPPRGVSKCQVGNCIEE